jgi:hypothetical protein
VIVRCKIVLIHDDIGPVYTPHVAIKHKVNVKDLEPDDRVEGDIGLFEIWGDESTIAEIANDPEIEVVSEK